MAATAVTSSWAYSIRPYREGDIPKILRLFIESGFPSHTEAHYRWKVLTIPCSVPTAWVAEAGDRIVGHYSGTPVRMRLQGQEVHAIHGSYAATLPSYRKHGIFTDLADTAAQHWSAAGYKVQIGVPWGAWGSRRDALGWVPLFGLTWVRRWLLPERAVARRTVPGRPPELVLRAVAWARPWDRLSPEALSTPITDIEIRELSEPDGALDRLWTRAGGMWDNLVVRDRQWLSWRYFAAPDAGYRVLLAERGNEPIGYLVLKVEHGPTGSIRGWIVDVFGARNQTEPRRALLRTALSWFRAANVERVAALVPEGGEIRREICGARFTCQGAGNFCVVPFDRAVPLETLRDASCWHLMGGDFDVM